MYEWQVQELIHRTHPPMGLSYSVRLGIDARGVAAVSVSEEIESGALYELNFAAIACRLRGQGGSHAVEMMEDTLHVITARCVDLGSASAEVFGYIDPENTNSKRMCSRIGLAYDTDIGGLEVWRKDLPLPDPTQDSATS